MKQLGLIAGILLFGGFSGNSQTKVKDTLQLSCPLPAGIMKSPSKEGIGYKGDVKTIVFSSSDTMLLSPIDGKIDLITIGEGGKYEVVMHHKIYNIWLLGLSKLLVKKNETVKKGQPIGKLNPTDEIEFLLFRDEEPIEAKPFLSCKNE